ncbi:MAG: SPOR domain-containing protein [Crocinitomicaceae bacterium]|nr:SPOR domain-containing protein [Crocinitomicaceae bacterium]
MNKYIIELLRLQTSVILPGLGSLMIGNSKSGKVVFNPLLKFNDGALAKFISEKDGIDKQTAQNQVAKFVREIEAELAKGNSFDIFQFGKFQKNAKGDIEFIQDSATSFVSEEKTTAPKTDKPVVQQDKPADSAKCETAVKPEVSDVKSESTEIKKVIPAVKKDEAKPAEKIKDEPKKESESLLEKLKSSKEDTQKKAAETEAKTKEELTKQAKNTFVPSDEIKLPKTEEKTPEISKHIPVAEPSKKEPATQEKNSFKPVEEIKAAVEKTETKPDLKPVTDETPKVNVSDAKKEDKKSDKKDEKKNKESVKEKFKKDKPQKVKHENPEGKKPKKKKRWVLWFIILIIVGGGATAGWFYKDQINEFLHSGVGDHDKDSTHAQNNTHQDTTLLETIVEEPITDDTTAVIEETTETVTEETHHEPVVDHSSPGGTYHIIGNAFSSEKNAENYVSKMKEKGYNAQNIGKYNGLYLVSLKSFGSKEEAKNNLSSVKADAEGAYVMKGK